MTKPYKRSPEVEYAVNRFELATGKTVIKAKRFQGSMKDYVQFVYEGNDKEFTFKDREYPYIGKIRFLGNCVITFERNLDYGGGKWVGKMAVEVRWEDLGMTYDNAYQPSRRKLQAFFA